MADRPDNTPPPPEGEPIVRTAAERAAAAALDDADRRAARRFWEDHAPPDRKHLVTAESGGTDPGGRETPTDPDGLPRYVWAEGLRTFRPAGAADPLPRPAVRDAVLAVTAGSEALVTAWSQRLADGDLTLPEWQRGMEDRIKLGHGATGLVGGGGDDNLTEREATALDERIADQFGWLEGFAIELKSGDQPFGGLVARAVMYATAAVGTYERVLRTGDAGVYPVERRALHGVHSCNGCVTEAAKGWQPFGILKDIGSCECFVAGTMIETERGPVPIEDVQLGDRVLTRRGYRPVVTLFRSQYVGPLKVVEAGGRRTTCTPNHPFRTQRGWVEAGQLVPGEDSVSLMKENRFELARVAAVFDANNR